MINHFRLFCILVLFLVLFFSFIVAVDSKKSLFKPRGIKIEQRQEEESSQNANSPKENKKFFSTREAEGIGTEAGPTDPALDKDIKLGAPGEEDVITFTSESDRDAKMRRLADLRRSAQDPELTDEALTALQQEERGLRKNVLRAELNHGEFSRERATALHAYGRNLFKQAKYVQIYGTAQSILAIHEKLDGVDSIETARALSNVGSTAWKLDKGEVARVTALRSLAIHLAHDYSSDPDRDAQEKAVMLCKGRLASYKYSESMALAATGISYQEYKDRMRMLGEGEGEGGAASGGAEEL
jgi:hypothetical protein